MSWDVVFRPEVEHDVADAARWYEAREPGLGRRFVEEVFEVWNRLAENPLLGSRKHPVRDIRWRYPSRFPYRVIYEVLQEQVIVVAVPHDHLDPESWLGRLR